MLRSALEPQNQLAQEFRTTGQNRQMDTAVPLVFLLFFCLFFFCAKGQLLRRMRTRSFPGEATQPLSIFDSLFNRGQILKERIFSSTNKFFPLTLKAPITTAADDIYDYFSFFFSQGGGGRVVRWCWVNFQCRGVLQF